MSFWKCTKLRNGSNPSFTVGKIYKLDDSNDTIVGDRDVIFGKRCCHKDDGGTISWLRTLGYDFEEVKNMFDKDSLKTGMLVETKNGAIWMVLRDSIYEDILLRVNNDSSVEKRIKFTEITKDLRHKTNDFLTIVKVVRPQFFPDIFNLGTEIASSTVVYHREEPKELTVSQIEEILGYKIKVVADNEDK